MSQSFTRGIPIDIDGTLSANSNGLIPTQKAVKTYVDTGLSNKVDTANFNLQEIYENSTPTAEITTDATNGAFTLKVGVADTDSILEGKNLAGTTTFSVKGNGTQNVRRFILEGGSTIDLGLTASYNDFDPQGYSNLRLETSLSNVDITGFVSTQVPGEVLIISNSSTGAITTNFITLKHQNTGSSNFNRIINGGSVIGDDIVLLPGDQCTLVWRVASVGQARWGVQSVTRTTRKHITTTPAQITSNQNDYPTSGYDILRLDTDASRDITGFANPLSGKSLTVMNVGSFNIVLKHQNTGSSGANRMILGNAASDVTILPNDCVTLMYDATTTRWRLISKSF